jgi:hypothetical protein
MLQDFADAPDDFDDDSVEEIWGHLDTCEACMEDYEAIRDGRHKEKEPPPVSTEKIIEGHSVDPEDIAETRVEAEEEDDSHINGLMPVGDDPTRNGFSEENSEGDKPTNLEIETPGDFVSRENTDSGNAAESEQEDTEDSRKSESSTIEGLISGDLSEQDEEMDHVETESLRDNEDRTSRERISAALLKAGEPEKTEESDLVDEDQTDTTPPPASEETDTPEPEEPAEEPEVTPAPAPRATRKPSKISNPAGNKPARPLQQKSSNQEPLEAFFNKIGAFLKKPRNAIICGGTLVFATAAVIVALYLFGPTKTVPSPVAGWEPLNIIETRVPLQEILIRKMYRGKIPAASGTDVTLDFRNVSRLVIAVDLDFIKGKTTPYEAIVLNPAGESVFQEAIPQIYLDDGRFFLRLIPKLFEVDQRYTLQLATGSADGTTRVIAESVFDVLK